MNGIINVDKPAGWTSQDVLNKLKGTFRKLDVKKIGHTGTLDPMATGLLTICLGKATRIIEYLDGDIKAYQCTMKLGMATDTLDITGEIITTADFSFVTENMIREAFARYTGVVSQVPPKYSALKLNGRPLYEYARSGQNIDVSIKKREIYIESIYISCINLEEGMVSFVVRCSKGTYIRTICDDIGKELGCYAAMFELKRLLNGVFTLDDAFTIDELVDMEISELKAHILPVDSGLLNLGRIDIADNSRKKFINGMKILECFYEIIELPKSDYKYKVPEHLNFYKVYNDGVFLGSASIDEKRNLKAEKVIVEDADF